MDRKTNLVLHENSPYESVSSLISFFQNDYPSGFFYKPVGLELEITNSCNLQCEGCPIINDEIRKPTDIITDEQYINVLHQSGKNGFFAYSLTGGEPFLKFRRIQNIIEAGHGLDIYKLNTNCTFFKTLDETKNLFYQLKKSGFGVKNKYIKASLVLSLGQQNLAGVPILNAVYAASLFYNYFNSGSTTCCLNLTGKDPILVREIYKTFRSLYKRITNKDFNENEFIIRFFPLNNVLTLKRLKLLSRDKITIPQLLVNFNKRYLSGGCFNTSIKNILSKNRAETLTPRMMIRPNGDIYACQSYNRVHKIGNILKESLFSVITKANENEILRTIYTKNLKGLYRLAGQTDPKISNIRLDTSYSPCDLCQLLTQRIKQKKLL